MPICDCPLFFLQYVVVPTRRSTAEAIQILISHAFGDAGSPYLIGVVSDALRVSLSSASICDQEGAVVPRQPIAALSEVDHMANVTQCEFAVDYYAMQYSLLINNAVEIVGGIFFIVTAFYIVRDKLKCDRYIAGERGRSLCSRACFIWLLAMFDFATSCLFALGPLNLIAGHIFVPSFASFIFSLFLRLYRERRRHEQPVQGGGPAGGGQVPPRALQERLPAPAVRHAR